MRVTHFTLSLASTIATVAAGSVGVGCQALKEPLGDALFSRGTTVYDYESKNFWSNTEILSPGCVFRPRSAGQLAEGLEALVDANAEFAVRGGGHMGIRVSAPQNQA